MASTRYRGLRGGGQGQRSLLRNVGDVMLAGTGIGTSTDPGDAEVPMQRVYGLDQPAKTPRGPERISDAQLSADLQACAEFCYVFQCNGCAAGSHLYRCTSRSRGDYFVCASGSCSDHCRHPDQ